MTKDYSRKGRNYEIFVRRAFNCERGKRRGANSEFYLELVKLEQESVTSIEYRWRFQKLKRYLNSAFTKLRKRKRYLKSDDEFSPIQLRLNHARNSDDLAKIASQGLAKLIECENRLREMR